MSYINIKGEETISAIFSIKADKYFNTNKNSINKIISTKGEI